MTDVSSIVLAATTFVLAACAVPFALTTATRHNDVAGRLWCGSLAAALGAGVIGSVQARSDGVLDVDAVGAACVVAAAGLWWSGIRAFRGAAPRPAFPIACALGTAGVWLLLDGAGAATRPTGLVLAGFFAGGAVLELGDGPMRRNLNVVILRVTLGVGALGAVVGGALSYREPAAVELTTAVLLVVATVTLQFLVAMRAERQGAWWSDDRAESRVFGVYSRDQFVDAAEDRLRRVVLVGGEAGLVLAEIEDMTSLNEAFGRQGGDAALTSLAQAIRAHVPAWSVIGHLGGGRFAVLGPVDSPDGAAELAAAIERGLYARDTGANDADDVPVPAVFGIADTYGTRPDLHLLLAAAGEPTIAD